MEWLHKEIIFLKVPLVAVKVETVQVNPPKPCQPHLLVEEGLTEILE
jgi:hypothetical protein